MLGRGLESLIPNKDDEKEKNEETTLLRGSHLATDSAISRNNMSSESSRTSIPPRSEVIPRNKNDNDNKGESVFQIEVDKIKPNPHQPRRFFDEEKLTELSSSIREMGVIQPLIVLKIHKDTNSGTDVEYQIVAGERRWRAAKMAGLERVPAVVRRVGQDKEKLEIALVENIQRTDLNPIEAARSYAKLQEEFGLTQREVAKRVGKSRETVSNVLRLLNLPTHIQDAVSQGKISDSQGRLLLAINDANQQNGLFEDLLRNNMSVRELRQRVDRIKNPKKNQSTDNHSQEDKKKTFDPELVSIEERLQELLGTKVSLQRGKTGGKIVINFFSPEEFKGIVKRLMPGG